MAIPDNPLVARVTLLFQKDNRTWINTFHCANSVPWTQQDLASLAAAFNSWDTSFYSLCRPSQVLLTQIQCRKLDPGNPLAYDLPVEPGRPGTVSGPVAPGNATATISWRTGLAGRKYRGRDYVPGINESSVNDSDQLISQLLSSFAAAAGQLILSLAGLNFPLTIFHRGDNTFTNVVTFIVEHIIDSQRRRLPGRGR